MRQLRAEATYPLKQVIGADDMGAQTYFPVGDDADRIVGALIPFDGAHHLIG